jgi:hypothetical protein
MVLNLFLVVTMLLDNLKKTEIDSILLNLSTYCPSYCLSFKNNQSCLLSEIKNFSIPKKTESLKNLTEKQKLSVIETHKACFGKNR